MERGRDASHARDGQTKRPVGVLLPSTNTTVEPDFYRMAPVGVTFHSARLLNTEVTLAGLRNLAADIETGTRSLASAEVELIAFACTTGSLLNGPRYDRELISHMTSMSGIPSVTTSTAVLEAFRELGVRDVSVGTPYIDEVNERVRQFFVGNGMNILCLKGLQIRKNTEIGRQEPATAMELGRDVDTPESEAIFLACTDFRSAEIAQYLEQELGKPVVTSNQATMWAILRRLCLATPVDGYGSLLRRLGPVRHAGSQGASEA